jgi:hypothetical protein
LIFVLSTKVIARLSAVIFSFKIPSTSSLPKVVFSNLLNGAQQQGTDNSGAEIGFSFKALDGFIWQNYF